MTGRRIVLATFGSLGDLHPYLAMARLLRDAGHEAVIATTDWHAAAVQAEGFAFAPMAPTTAQLGDPQRHVRALFHPRHGPEYLVREMLMPYVRQSHRDLLEATRGADLLVSHPLAFAAPLVAEQTGLAWASTVLSPFSLLSARDAPVFPNAPLLGWLGRLGLAPYRLLYVLMRHTVARWEQPLAALRREIGLKPAPPALVSSQYSPLMNLALFSPQLAAPQPDWPRNTIVCGFPRFEGSAPDEANREALEGFLAAGTPPVVFTLGSSAFALADNFWAHAVKAAEALKVRLLMITGDERVRTPWVTRNVAAFEYLSYASVFPFARALVHQGGIGTLSQAIAAGKPQLIVPVAFDQPDNAARAARLGVARVLPFARASAESLQRELGRLLASATYENRATELAQVIAAEPGAARAADLVARLTRSPA